MTFEVILIVLLVAVVAGVGVRRAAQTRHEQRMETARNFRLSRKVANEDVTAFGEELSDLHVETLTTAIDDDMRTDYQRRSTPTRPQRTASATRTTRQE